VKVEVKEFRLKLYPKDFSKVRHFYEQDLGLAVANQWDRGENDRGVMFQVGATILELLSPNGEYREIVGADVSWKVADVSELWSQWSGKPNVVFDLRDNDWGDSSFCIADPEGFQITFFSKRTHEDLA